MGAYHTSLRVGSSGSSDHHGSPYTTTYSFVANRGIVQEKQTRNNNTMMTLPSHATFKEEIVLGSCTCQRGEINEIVQLLSQHYFTSISYHLVHRNCNHFTETFAIALIYYQDFMEQKNAISNSLTTTPGRPHQSNPKRLSTYPDWINRLANTGANVISHDTDIIPCHPYHEAFHAVTKMTMDHFTGTTTTANNDDDDATTTTTDKASPHRWGFTSLRPGGSRTTTSASGTATSSSSTSKTKKNEKKELTEAQKKLLEKIRKK